MVYCVGCVFGVACDMCGVLCAICEFGVACHKCGLLCAKSKFDVLCIIHLLFYVNLMFCV